MLEVDADRKKVAGRRGWVLSYKGKGKGSTGGAFVEASYMNVKRQCQKPWWRSGLCDRRPWLGGKFRLDSARARESDDATLSVHHSQLWLPQQQILTICFRHVTVPLPCPIDTRRPPSRSLRRPPRTWICVRTSVISRRATLGKGPYALTSDFLSTF